MQIMFEIYENLFQKRFQIIIEKFLPSPVGPFKGVDKANEDFYGTLHKHYFRLRTKALSIFDLKDGFDA